MTDPADPEQPQDPKAPPPKADPPPIPPPRPRPGQGHAPRPRPLGMPFPGSSLGTRVPGQPPDQIGEKVPSRQLPKKSGIEKPSNKTFIIPISAVLVVAAAYVSMIFMSRNLLIVDGKTISHYSFSKGTVKDLLGQYQISLGAKDIVTPPLASPVRWGQKIQVVRVTENFEKKTELVDFVLEWKNRTTKNLRKIEIQNGRRELKVWFVKHVLNDGKEISHEDSPVVVHRTQVTRVVFLSERDHPDKIYDLSKCKSLPVIATAYWKGDPKVPGVITYSGHKVERGLVAVDPKTIPLGWRLYIPGYGYAYSSDTGSKIKGKRIDLFVENKKASRQWEYKVVTVYFLEKAKKW